MPNTDPVSLHRFLNAQADVYSVALAELCAGLKESHWMWFIFPQLAGLGFSDTARRYALCGLDEARCYLAHPALGPRLVECSRALLQHTDLTANQILGCPDDVKLRSSMTLFRLANPDFPEFGKVLDQFYGGLDDPKTLDLLEVR
jgi:uncharacterized protein (DUF1810 family)